MRGSIKRRYEGSWSLILDLGYQTDPKTGLRKRKQRWVTFRGTKQKAEAHLNELVRAAGRGEFVERSKLTVGEWLAEWIEKAIKPPAKRPGTYRVYKSVNTRHLTPAIGAIRLQELKAADIKRYYTDKKLSESTLAQHHAIIHGALSAAVLEGMVIRNVAHLVVGKPQQRDDHDHVSGNCWDTDEARAFLVAAKKAGTQPAALYALALDSGARKNELCGLQWGDVDLDAGTVTFVRQLVKLGAKPEFGPIKNDVPRTVDLSSETVALLKEHKRTQAELKMRNRVAYRDLGMVFAREWSDLHGREASLGLPLLSNNLGQREFAKIIKAAKVKTITIHGLRHTSATLLLKAGVPPQVVQRRLGHKRIEITLGIYAHVLPSMQQDAARRLGVLLHG